MYFQIRLVKKFELEKFLSSRIFSFLISTILDEGIVVLEALDGVGKSTVAKLLLRN